MVNKAFLPSTAPFIETQCASFCWFLSTGVLEALKILQANFYTSNLVDINCFCENFLFLNSKPLQSNSNRYTSTLTIKLYVPVGFYLKTPSCNLKDQKEGFTFLFLGDIPLMTNRGTFIINGYEKLCVNQLLRSPGLYFYRKVSTAGVVKKSAVLIPERGSWLSINYSSLDDITISLDKGEEFSFFYVLKAFGLSFSEIKAYLSFYKLTTSSTVSRVRSTFNNVTFLRFRDQFQTKFLNAQFYCLGLRGRIFLNKLFQNNLNNLSTSIIRLGDLFKFIEYFFSLRNKLALITDLDHLDTKYIRSIGEILQNQVLVGLKSLNRFQEITPAQVRFGFLGCNIPPSNVLSSLFQTFFSSSQLIQFLDQTNLISEISQRRRLTHSLFRAFTDSTTRAVHSSYFGRICPIETSEGNRAGLSSALAAYTRVNELGMLETPFFVVSNCVILTNCPIVYLTSYEEQFFVIAPFDIAFDISTKRICPTQVRISFQNTLIDVPSSSIQLISVSSFQFFSLSVGLIPFFEHDDANRVLMGANMQRQAIPLLYPHKPIIGTGLETQVAVSLALKSYSSGFICGMTSVSVSILSSAGQYLKYFLQKFIRSNQGTCLHQRAIVWCGEAVKSGQILADSSAMENGEIALGQNLLVGYMVWNGFNFEDSILINERVVFSDLFTSITILNFIFKIFYTTDSIEELSSCPNNLSLNMSKTLDCNGIIRPGVFIKPFDVLVGKMTYIPNSMLSSFRSLYNLTRNPLFLFGYDTSILATENCYGRVLTSLLCTPENTVNLFEDIRFKIIIFVAQLRKLQVGDKLSGRHGNKGILAKILAYEDMPYLPNGQALDLIFNPLGVPSRMNVGQLFEGLLGFSGMFLSKRFKVRPFDEGVQVNSSRKLITTYLKKAKQFTKFFWLYDKGTPGKLRLRDGKTGTWFDNSILVCKSYILKLNHFVIDKIQARATNGYSLVSQQPSHGKSLNGGQRFGEMEVWALEAFGAAYTLQEILTLQSDDIIGRNKLLTAIVQNRTFVNFGIPESFNVLLFELKALGLNIEFYKFDFL